MPKYLFYLDDSGIDKNKLKEYLGKSKSREISTLDDLQIAFRQMFSEVTLVLGNTDINTSILNMLKDSKLKKSTKLITKSLPCARLFSDKVANIIVLDRFTEKYPTYWNTKLTTIQNMSELLRQEKPSFQVTEDSHVYNALNLVEKDGLCYLEIKGVEDKEFIKEIKLLLKERKKHIKALVRGHNKEVKNNFKVNISPGTDVTVYKDIEQYLTLRGYLTEAQINELKSDIPEDTFIEEYATQQGLISNEELTDIVSQFFCIPMLNKESLENLQVRFDKVSPVLKQKGVVETYSQSDECVIILPYNKRDVLLGDVKATINYDKIVYTTPQYTKRMISDAS